MEEWSVGLECLFFSFPTLRGRSCYHSHIMYVASMHMALEISISSYTKYTLLFLTMLSALIVVYPKTKEMFGYNFSLRSRDS